MVECAKVPTVNIINKSANGAVASSIICIAGTLSICANSITTTVVGAGSICLVDEGKVLFLEIVQSSKPFLGSIELLVDILEESPTSILGVVN